jgi:hypothetical protein
MHCQQDNPEEKAEHLVRAEMQFHMKNGLEIKLPINVPFSHIDSLKEKLSEGLSVKEKTDYLVMQGSSNSPKDFFILPRSAIICVEFRIKCILDPNKPEPTEDLSWKQKFKKLKTTLITMLTYIRNPLI